MAEEFIAVNLEGALKDKMARNAVHFTFRKKDGTERKAFGTRRPAIIETEAGSDALPKGHDGDFTFVEKTGAIAFFDLEKLAWRSFQEGSLISIDD